MSVQFIGHTIFIVLRHFTLTNLSQYFFLQKANKNTRKGCIELRDFVACAKKHPRFHCVLETLTTDLDDSTDLPATKPRRKKVKKQSSTKGSEGNALKSFIADPSQTSTVEPAGLQAAAEIEEDLFSSEEEF